MKDKKKLTAARVAIFSALKKAYDLLNQEGELQQVEEIALPRLANAIVRHIDKDLSELKESERFAGKSEEEVSQIKESEHNERIESLQQDAAEQFRKMREAKAPALQPDPEEDQETEELDDQDPDSDEDTQSEDSEDDSDDENSEDQTDQQPDQDQETNLP